MELYIPEVIFDFFFQGFLTPSASVFASHAVRTIGYTKRTTGYWVHGIQVRPISLWMERAKPSFVVNLFPSQAFGDTNVNVWACVLKRCAFRLFGKYRLGVPFEI